MFKKLINAKGRTLFLPHKVKISLPGVHFQSMTFFNDVNNVMRFTIHLTVARNKYVPWQFGKCTNIQRSTKGKYIIVKC